GAAADGRLEDVLPVGDAPPEHRVATRFGRAGVADDRRRVVVLEWSAGSALPRLAARRRLPASRRLLLAPAARGPRPGTLRRRRDVVRRGEVFRRCTAGSGPNRRALGRRLA